MRPDTETSILRQRGTLFQSLPNGLYSNIYELKVINKTFNDLSYEVKLISPQGEIVPLGDFSEIPAQQSLEARFILKLKEAGLQPNSTPVVFEIYAGKKLTETITTGFLGPASISSNE